jgi:hypothetical protein
LHPCFDLASDAERVGLHLLDSFNTFL